MSQHLDGLLWISLELNNLFYWMPLAMQRRESCDVWLSTLCFRSFDFFWLPACGLVMWWLLAYGEELIKERTADCSSNRNYLPTLTACFLCSRHTDMISLMKDDSLLSSICILRCVFLATQDLLTMNWTELSKFLHLLNRYLGQWQIKVFQTEKRKKLLHVSSFQTCFCIHVGFIWFC